ncbi:hypothetical protein [Paraburkholderia sp.]|nr:hypothetical protein [Paraburkholderia sp.]HZZ04845.1 hypothetical protein [Paraburkholderia sp.]
MKGTSYNEGEYPARVIVDRDTINDLQIPLRGIIELRELEMRAEESGTK